MTEPRPTDPTGRSFLSYRRSRLEEASHLVQAQRERGIPTWRDVDDLDEVPTEPELRQVLSDPTTANAVLWLTPEVAGSATILNVEAPVIVRRAVRGDGFFVVPAVAGGLDYEAAADMLQGHVGVHDLAAWNLRKVEGDPASLAEICTVAERVLRRRLAAIHEWLPPGEPVRVRLMTRQRPATEVGWAALIDWSRRFHGRHIAEPSAWEAALLPALCSLREAVRTKAPRRAVEATGHCTLTSGLALGSTFSSRDDIHLSWRQVAQGHGDQVWSLHVPQEDAGVIVETSPSRPEGTVLAALLSINEDVEPAFGASRNDLPVIRATVRIRPAGERFEPLRIASPGQAAALAAHVVTELRQARRKYPAESIHLFAAVPVGLAVLIGQQLNTLGPVQTYEHEEHDSVGRYRPELLLLPTGRL
jgi:hypothetical protein